MVALLYAVRGLPKPGRSLTAAPGAADYHAVTLVCPPALLVGDFLAYRPQRPAWNSIQLTFCASYLVSVTYDYLFAIGYADAEADIYTRLPDWRP
jgi:hypothetical protein